MTCPDLLTSIQPLLFIKPSGTIIIFEPSYLLPNLVEIDLQGADDFSGSQRDMHKKITVASFPEEIRLKSNLAI